MLVYSKTGPKKLFNCVQRMANAMRAGVAACAETNHWFGGSPPNLRIL